MLVTIFKGFEYCHRTIYLLMSPRLCEVFCFPVFFFMMLRVSVLAVLSDFIGSNMVVLLT